MKKRFILGIICLVFLAIQSASAAAIFVVKQIKIKGLQRVQEKTVLSYIPIHINQPITTQDTVNILVDLYKTGFFSDVRLARQGSTLIVTVVERPTIGLIQIEGNKEFTEKQLTPVLKEIGIEEGAPYDNSKVNAIVQGLKEQYNQLGYYAVQVNAQAEPAPRNRVILHIKVKEGPIAKIKHITIQGNHAFKEKELLKVFTSKTTSWWKLSFLTKSDRYSRVQLAKDLEQLRTFYYNHGYLRFQVVDQKVVVSPDNKSVDIIVTITEGPVYKVKGYQINGLANYPVESKEVNKYVSMSLVSGQVFAKQNVLNASETIRLYFASKGHAFPVINTEPEINDQTRQVFITYTVAPGPISYVRYIDFTGNTRTTDTALRNNIRQMEGGPYSITDVEQSKARLAYLPYLQDVSVDTNPVPGKSDQVDLNYHVKETNAGKASVQGGYSTSDGFIYGASLAEPNLLGTGKYGAINFNASQYQKSYSLTYADPYFTTYGVSQSVTVFSTITTPSTDLNQASYTMDGYGGTVVYGIPLTLYNRINLGAGYTYIVLNDVNGSYTSPTVVDFVNQHPSPYNQFKGIVSWQYSTLDRAMAPTSGFSQLLGGELGVPVVSNSLSYYKLTAETKYFYPLGYGFIINPNASLGYGNGYGNIDTLPFFNNFYAGGIETLPGYAPNSLGPQNPLQSGAALGGNFRVLGGMNFIFPNFTEKVRTAVFLDAGNVFETVHTCANGCNGSAPVYYEDIELRNIRMSSGLMVVWYSPMGPLQFSLAEAINSKSEDQKELFGFSFGASI